MSLIIYDRKEDIPSDMELVENFSRFLFSTDEKILFRKTGNSFAKNNVSYFRSRKQELISLIYAISNYPDKCFDVSWCSDYDFVHIFCITSGCIYWPYPGISYMPYFEDFKRGSILYRGVSYRNVLSFIDDAKKNINKRITIDELNLDQVVKLKKPFKFETKDKQAYVKALNFKYKVNFITGAVACWEERPLYKIGQQMQEISKLAFIYDDNPCYKRMYQDKKKPLFCWVRTMGNPDVIYCNRSDERKMPTERIDVNEILQLCQDYNYVLLENAHLYLTHEMYEQIKALPSSLIIDHNYANPLTYQGAGWYSYHDTNNIYESDMNKLMDEYFHSAYEKITEPERELVTVEPVPNTAYEESGIKAYFEHMKKCKYLTEPTTYNVLMNVVRPLWIAKMVIDGKLPVQFPGSNRSHTLYQKYCAYKELDWFASVEKYYDDFTYLNRKFITFFVKRDYLHSRKERKFINDINRLNRECKKIIEDVTESIKGRMYDDDAGWELVLNEVTHYLDELTSRMTIID